MIYGCNYNEHKFRNKRTKMLILKQDTPGVVMPVCYHPTTVLVVDDDVNFLNKLKASVSKNIALICFDNPDAVIDYIKNSRELQIPLASRLHFTGKNDTQTCGFARMLEARVQDIIHPFPKDIDLSFVKPIDEPILPEGSPKPHDTLEEFERSQYILTEKSFYYYNQMSKECEWIASDPAMLKTLDSAFQEETSDLSSDQLNRITQITHHHRPAKLGFSIAEVRNEPYNRNRFKEIVLIISDDVMPGKNGIELVKALDFPGITLEHAVIILAQTASDEFKQNIKTLPLPTEFIEKNDPAIMAKLLDAIEKKASRIFQNHSQKALTILSNDLKEGSSFVFDQNFCDIFNPILKENNICEMYLYDRQGSYLLLDEHANPSWFIIRCEKGMENSLEKAVEYGAPLDVIEALSEKKVLLSLYEESDFARLKEKSIRTQLEALKAKKKEAGKKEAEPEPEIKAEIDWGSYLHPASVFESEDNSSDISLIKQDDNNPKGVTHKYYYVYIKNFPESEINQSRILSYQDFLNQNK